MPATAIATPISTAPMPEENVSLGGPEQGSPQTAVPSVNPDVAESQNDIQPEGDNLENRPPSYVPISENMVKEALLGNKGELNLGAEVDQRLFSAVQDVKLIVDRMKTEGHDIGYLHKLLDKIYPSLAERNTGISNLTGKTGKERRFHTSQEIIIAIEVLEMDELLKATGFAHTITNGGKNEAIVTLPSISNLKLKEKLPSLQDKAQTFVATRVADLVGANISPEWQTRLGFRRNEGVNITIKSVPHEDQIVTDYWQIALGQMGGGDKDAAMQHLTQRELTRYLVYEKAGLDIANQAHIAAIDLLHDPSLDTATLGSGKSELVNLRQRMLMREKGERDWGKLSHAERMRLVMKAIDDVGLVTASELMTEIESADLIASKDKRKSKSDRIEAIAVQHETGELSINNINHDDLDNSLEKKAVAEKVAADTKTAYDRIEELDTKNLELDDHQNLKNIQKSIHGARQLEERRELENEETKNRYDKSVPDTPLAKLAGELTNLEADVNTPGSIKYLLKTVKDASDQITAASISGVRRQAGALIGLQKNFERHTQLLTEAQGRKTQINTEISAIKTELSAKELAYKVAKKQRESLESERENLIKDYFGGGVVGTSDPDASVRTKILAGKEKDKKHAEEEVTRITNILSTKKAEPTDENKRNCKITRRIGQITKAEEIAKIRAQITQHSIREELSNPQQSYDKILDIIFNSTATPEQMIDDINLRQEALTKAEIVMEIVKLQGIDINSLNIILPDKADLTARFGTKSRSNPHPVTLSEYMARSVKEIHKLEEDNTKLRRLKPSGWQLSIAQNSDLIKKWRLEDELLLESQYKELLPYLKINRFRTADLVERLIDRLGEKALSKDPFRPSYELTQPDLGYKIEKAIHLETGKIVYEKPLLDNSLFKKKEVHHGKILYEQNDSAGIKHSVEVVIEKADSPNPAAPGEVFFKWNIIVDQNLHNTLQARYPNLYTALNANLPQSLIDKMYNPISGDLLPSTPDLIDGSRLDLTQYPGGEKLRNLSEVNLKLDTWRDIDYVSQKLSVSFGRYILEDMPKEQRQEALKYFSGFNLLSFGGNYTVVRESDGRLTVTGEIPGGQAKVDREDLAVFINRYRDRWKSVIKPGEELESVDVDAIASEINILLNNVGTGVQRAIQKYP